MVSVLLEEVIIGKEIFTIQGVWKSIYLIDEPSGKLGISTGGSVELEVVQQTLDLAVGNRPIEELHLVIGPADIVVERVHY